MILEKKHESFNEMILKIAESVRGTADDNNNPVSRKLCKEHIAKTYLRGIGHADEMILNTTEYERLGNRKRK